MVVGQLRCRLSVVVVGAGRDGVLFLGDSGNRRGLLCDWRHRRRIIN